MRDVAKYNAYQRQYYQKNKVRINAGRNNETNKRKQREHHLKHKYRITPANFDKMLLDQGGVCASCGSADPQDKRGWHIDHDYKRVYQKVRGIVCRPCNMTIGFAKESTQRLRACARYLEASDDGYDVS